MKESLKDVEKRSISGAFSYERKHIELSLSFDI